MANNNLANAFMLTIKDKIPMDKFNVVCDKVSTLSDDEIMHLAAVKLYEPRLILLHSIVVGNLGIDRMICGQIGLGILKMFTFGGCGVWTLVDIFVLHKKMKEKNVEILLSFCN